MIGVPIITQSDPGTDNYGVANAHTVIWHRLDPGLANTLQHCFTDGHNNILSEIKWSVFRRNFSPGFEDILEQGVQDGLYDVNNPLEKWAKFWTHNNIFLSLSFHSLLFHWIAIPWLQVKIDKWVNFKNTTAPCAVRNKILPHGVPALIHSRPSHFGAVDFKVCKYTPYFFFTRASPVLDTGRSWASRWSQGPICTTRPPGIRTGTTCF